MHKVLFLLIFPLFLQAQNKKQIFSPEEVKQDMAFLKKRFEKIHPAMYYYTSKDAYSKTYDSLYNTINQPLSYLETYKTLSTLVTNVQDGHTSFRFNKKRFNKKKVKFVPFNLRKIEGKYYLSANYSRDSSIVRGSEVLMLNNEPISELIEKIKQLVSSDKNNDAVKEYYATGSFPNYYIRKNGEIDSIKITYRLPKNDSTFHRKVACLTSAEISKIGTKRYKTFKRPNLSMKVVDSLNHIGILDITSFSMAYKYLDFRNLKFKLALKNSFKAVKRQNIEHLIIDVRGNGGGNILNITRLLQYLSPKPFTLVDTLALKKKAYFVYFKPLTTIVPLLAWTLFPHRKEELMYRVNKKDNKKKPNLNLAYRGKTYFLTDPGCYSATVFTVNLAKDMGIPEKIIGQPVGGASWGSFAANWQDFKLPNTKYIVHTPLMKINHRMPNKLNHDFFLQPDYEVNRNYEELFKNNTSVIDFTVDMIKASKAARMK